MNDDLKRRRDGTLEESLGAVWSAQYAEDPQTGLWSVEIYEHDAPEWRSDGYGSLEDARTAAKHYYDQL